MKNTLNKIFSRHALTNAARIAAIAAACVTMSALTLPKPPSAPPITPPIAPSTKITKPADSADSTDSTQSNFAGGCVGDLNNDHNVDGSDLGSLLSQYGACAGSYPADLNLDGCVDASDLGTLLAQYGSCPNQAQLDWATVLEWNPDPSVIADATVRQKIINSGFPWRVLDIGTGIEMLLVPAGTFQMGASPGDAEAYSWESPTHQVTLSKPFYLGKTEVTQAQWQAKMGSNPSYFGGNPNNPVEQVDWNGIELFSAATGLRLPSEAEWEYACRGGTTTARNGVLNNTDWYDGNNSPWGTKPVAGKLANPYGFYDMLGNVWEWCQDWYGDYSVSSVTDPTGPSVGPYGDYKVLRGGFWNSYSTYCRTSYRNGDSPSRRNINIGFRVARTAEYSVSWATVLESLPNAAVVLDAAVRAKISASGFPWRVLDTGTGIEMLLIPGGTFTMGCSASNSYGCYSDESPNHQVTLSKAFYLGKTEVTQAQWQAKMGSNPSYFKGYSDSPSRPVETVNWNDIAGFNTATGFRLPSEAEWEYACRGGTTTAYHSMPGYPNGTNDDSLLGNIAWYSGNNGASGSSTYGTKPVAGKAANAFGMYDMSGNVFEWCNDWYGSYAAGNVTDPAGPSSGSYRVLRGGFWDGYSSYCRSSYRNHDVPGSRYYGIGFRVARTVDYASPTVTAISPASGLTSGGTTITLNGTNFFGASSVTVGGALATSVNVVSATVLTAVTPAGSISSAVSVSVTTPRGTGTLVGAFSYYEAGTLSWASVLEALPNAAVVTDATVRAKIVASGFPWRVRDNSSGIEMLLIPGGTFTMGCSASNSYDCNYDENPTHQVTLSKAFYLGKTEVTQAQWQAKTGNNPSYFKSYSDSPSRPVENVSWDDIAGFNTATGLRLPSEAEWEYACRGNTTTAFHSMPGYPNGTNDDSLLGNIAWYSSNNSPYGTKPVAGKAANAFGMYDMSGNVWEWCNDWYGDDSASNATDPTGPSSGSYRVLRGGSWVSYSNWCRSSFRNYDGPDDRGTDMGFRVARTP